MDSLTRNIFRADAIFDLSFGVLILLWSDIGRNPQ
jgi:hypothetical protein